MNKDIKAIDVLNSPQKHEAMVDFLKEYKAKMMELYKEQTNYDGDAGPADGIELAQKMIEAWILEQEEAKEKACFEAEQLINLIGPLRDVRRIQEILRGHYLQAKQFKEISKDFGISEATCSRLHHKGLEALYQAMEKNGKR